ncbi:hypothetical protein B0H11DRAFT_2193081 [Mycena galericulata]|nr:hypothetical protein B0H11DRAFT_2193081 [Mycena galericulata]
MYHRGLKPIPEPPTTGLRCRVETLLGFTGLKWGSIVTCLRSAAIEWRARRGRLALQLGADRNCGLFGEGSGEWATLREEPMVATPNCTPRMRRLAPESREVARSKWRVGGGDGEHLGDGGSRHLLPAGPFPNGTEHCGSSGPGYVTWYWVVKRKQKKLGDACESAVLGI